MNEDGAAAFVKDLWEQVEDRIMNDPDLMARDAFVHLVGDHLLEDGVLEEIEVCYVRAPSGRGNMEVAAYDVSADGRSLDLLTATVGMRGATLNRDAVRRQLRRAGTFAEECRNGVHRTMERSSPAFDMAHNIHMQWPDLEKIRVFLVTDGRVTMDNLEGEIVAGLPTTYEVWDVTRIQRLVTSGRRDEELVINLDAPDRSVLCLPAPATDEQYRCLMALLPGELLAELYEQYGTRLLQRNVRAFLQARGKVNKGINTTLRSEPSRFLAYNNGISATATDVRTCAGPDGTVRITRLTDLQIVNGGQTTASLHHAWKRDRLDLSRVVVPAKITVVQGEVLEELVPRISRYANSQNAIREADFEANSPFHVELEKLSRSMWAPAVGGATRQTRWYYERVRGQYQVDVAREGTPARKRLFKLEQPTRQRFGKTDMAKYEMTYLRRPHEVSQGGEKCFQRWTLDVRDVHEQPDQAYFRALVAKALLFERTRSLIRSMGFGGYLGQTTTYVVAVFVDRLGRDLEFDAVWRLQDLPREVVEALSELVTSVRSVIASPPANGNVTEWCKKEDCWKAVREVEQ